MLFYYVRLLFVSGTFGPAGSDCLGFYYQQDPSPVAGSCSVYSFVSCFSGRTLRSGDFESLFSPVHRAYHRLEGAELLCVGFFLCGGFLFSII